MSVEWSYYDKFDDIMDKYLPDRGEGEKMYNQIVTAITKLVYKWYNDGDVFDNTYNLEGWANDLSTYANWLRKYADGADYILDGIEDCTTEDDYEDLLQELADLCLDEDYLSSYDVGKRDSIYECDGPFEFNMDLNDGYDDDEEEYEDEDDDEYDEDDDDEGGYGHY